MPANLPDAWSLNPWLGEGAPVAFQLWRAGMPLPLTMKKGGLFSPQPAKLTDPAVSLLRSPR